MEAARNAPSRINFSEATSSMAYMTSCLRIHGRVELLKVTPPTGQSPSRSIYRVRQCCVRLSRLYSGMVVVASRIDAYRMPSGHNYASYSEPYLGSLSTVFSVRYTVNSTSFTGCP